MTDEQFKVRDARRDIGAELLQSVCEMTAGQWVRKTTFEPLSDGTLEKQELISHHKSLKA